jgi:sirohydrochlorin ferrochelatase
VTNVIHTQRVLTAKASRLIIGKDAVKTPSPWMSQKPIRAAGMGCRSEGRSRSLEINQQHATSNRNRAVTTCFTPVTGSCVNGEIARTRKGIQSHSRKWAALAENEAGGVALLVVVCVASGMIY